MEMVERAWWYRINHDAEIQRVLGLAAVSQPPVQVLCGDADQRLAATAVLLSALGDEGLPHVSILATEGSKDRAAREMLLDLFGYLRQNDANMAPYPAHGVVLSKDVLDSMTEAARVVGDLEKKHFVVISDLESAYTVGEVANAISRLPWDLVAILIVPPHAASRIDTQFVDPATGMLVRDAEPALPSEFERTDIQQCFEIWGEMDEMQARVHVDSILGDSVSAASEHYFDYCKAEF